RLSRRRRRESRQGSDGGRGPAIHRVLAQTRWRLIRGSLLPLELTGALASGAAAQADTPRRDTTAAAAQDTTPRDTTQRDTTPALLPVFAAAIAPGPFPLG